MALANVPWKGWLILVAFLQIICLCIAYVTKYGAVSTPFICISLGGIVSLMYCMWRPGCLVHLASCVILCLLTVIPFSITLANEQYRRKYWHHALVYSIVIITQIFAILVGLYMLDQIKRGKLNESNNKSERRGLLGGGSSKNKAKRSWI